MNMIISYRILFENVSIIEVAFSTEDENERAGVWGKYKLNKPNTPCSSSISSSQK